MLSTMICVTLCLLYLMMHVCLHHLEYTARNNTISCVFENGCLALLVDEIVACSLAHCTQSNPLSAKAMEAASFALHDKLNHPGHNEPVPVLKRKEHLKRRHKLLQGSWCVNDSRIDEQFIDLARGFQESSSEGHFTC